MEFMLFGLLAFFRTLFRGRRAFRVHFGAFAFRFLLVALCRFSFTLPHGLPGPFACSLARSLLHLATTAGGAC
uniref:Putative secreted peptide n=1 Tax=Anopheles braziliensis TaxID=58242 RepID=A0A2M3ZS45_9DIPT